MLRIVMALTMIRHPEVRAKRASKGDGPNASAASFEARLSGEHLRMTVHGAE
jgi:hypothetical protein